MSKEILIEQFLKVITGGDYDVEIIEGVVDIIKEGFFHIYVAPDDFIMIGAFSDEEVERAQVIKDHQYHIREILQSDETV